MTLSLTWRRFGGLTSLTLLTASLGACSKTEDTPAPPQPVQTFVISNSAEAPFRRFPGEVAPARAATMSFDVPGRLVSLPAEQGYFYKQGDLLAQLDQRDFQAAVRAAQATFNAAQSEFNRRSALIERRAISARELDQSRQGFEVADASLRTARRALEDSQLRAPFAGRVAQTMVDNFQTVQPTQPVLVFQDVDTLEVNVNVPESSMSLGGQGVTTARARELVEAAVEFAALPGERFPLTLVSFATQAAATTRTFRIAFALDPPEGKNILPGMTSSVLLRLHPQAAAEARPEGMHRVPVQAIATVDGGTWVWRLDPGSLRVSRVPVEAVAVTDQTVTVRAPGLKEGDEIVASGVRFLAEGVTVRRMAARQT